MPAVKILVVDDASANLHMMRSLLQLGGDEVYTAHDGVEALAVLERQPIQLAIVDWMMPEMDGLELVQRIRNGQNARYIYLIMLTAVSDRAEVVKVLESGVDDYIIRGVQPRELLARINIGKRIIRLENDLQNALDDQRKTLDQIERARQEWQATADSIPQLVCLLDRSGHVLRVNKNIEAWGLSWSDSAPPMFFARLLAQVYDDFANDLSRDWMEISEQLKQGLECEYEALDANLGHYFAVHFEPTDPFDELPERTSFAVLSIQDITERKKLELALNRAHQETSRLLHNILPASIAERLRAGEETIADHFTGVSVMFVDLVGFTQLTQTLAPAQLIDLLNAIFSSFDTLTEKHNLEKIKTIGDAYMVVGGIPRPHPQHAQALVTLALDMFAAIAEINTSNGMALQLRVGIDSGDVVAGVIGKRKFIYDLWGDTVNTASRMESHGVNGQIQLTANTYALLSDTSGITQRGEIEIKGKGRYLTYLLDPQAR